MENTKTLEYVVCVCCHEPQQVFHGRPDPTLSERGYCAVCEFVEGTSTVLCVR